MSLFNRHPAAKAPLVGSAERNDSFQKYCQSQKGFDAAFVDVGRELRASNLLAYGQYFGADVPSAVVQGVLEAAEDKKDLLSLVQQKVNEWAATQSAQENAAPVITL